MEPDPTGSCGQRPPWSMETVLRPLLLISVVDLYRYAQRFH